MAQHIHRDHIPVLANPELQPEPAANSNIQRYDGGFKESLKAGGHRQRQLHGLLNDNMGPALQVGDLIRTSLSSAAAVQTPGRDVAQRPWGSSSKQRRGCRGSVAPGSWRSAGSVRVHVVRIPSAQHLLILKFFQVQRLKRVKSQTVSILLPVPR
jgi:hypothetical protein